MLGDPPRHMRNAFWLLVILAPYLGPAAAGLVVGVKLAALDPMDYPEGIGIYAGFFFLSMALSAFCAVCFGIAVIKWRRRRLVDPKLARYYRNVAIGSAIGVVVGPTYCAGYGLGIAYAVARVA